LFHVYHGSGLGEQVLWVVLISVQFNTLVGEESSGEFIGANDSELSLVDIEVLANVQVLPGVVLGLIIWVWEFVSLEENSLWDSGVLNSVLNDVDGVIVEIVEDDALSNSEVLVGILNNWLLEIGEEFKNLSVIFQPLWGNAWDCIILVLLS